VFDTNKFNKVDVNINPLESKLFTNDVFTINKHNQVIIEHSSIRSGPAIPGVLILDGNKTYGRQYRLEDGQSYTRKRAEITGGRLLYKCIPDDIRLPSFLVPYEIKNMGFSKVFKNLYVTINFDNWEDKHPKAKLDNVIGPVDILDNFYEYQLYCKSLNASIQKFQKDTSKSLESRGHDGIIETILTKYPNIQDRTDQSYWNIITIDPLNSQDFDDGFSIVELDEGIKQLSVYISNVTIWMDVLNLWNSFSRRISTIYLPDKKRPMLPTILSDCLCSLQQNVRRVAFVMDVFIKDNEITNIKFCNAIIKVSNNYVYEDAKLLADQKYHNILDATHELSKKYKYINNVRNSHELVCYLMILMNYHSAKELIKHKTGIFRSTIIKKEFSVPDTLPEEVGKFIKIWNSASGQYIDGSEIVDTRHELLDVDAYIHITSPIRRLVDLLNMIKFQTTTGMINLSESTNNFYNKWLDELEYINTTMRSIRKVQCDCSLLDLCHNNPEVMEKDYNGYLFDKIYRNDGLYQYIVFLPNLKLSSRITLREDFENFTDKKFKLYLFNDEEKFKRNLINNYNLIYINALINCYFFCYFSNNFICFFSIIISCSTHSFNY
jgi:exoribonuclease R